MKIIVFILLFFSTGILQAQELLEAYQNASKNTLVRMKSKDHGFYFGNGNELHQLYQLNFPAEDSDYELHFFDPRLRTSQGSLVKTSNRMEVRCDDASYMLQGLAKENIQGLKAELKPLNKKLRIPFALFEIEGGKYLYVDIPAYERIIYGDSRVNISVYTGTLGNMQKLDIDRARNSVGDIRLETADAEGNEGLLIISKNGNAQWSTTEEGKKVRKKVAPVNIQQFDVSLLEIPEVTKESSFHSPCDIFFVKQNP